MRPLVSIEVEGGTSAYGVNAGMLSQWFKVLFPCTNRAPGGCPLCHKGSISVSGNQLLDQVLDHCHRISICSDAPTYFKFLIEVRRWRI